MRKLISIGVLCIALLTGFSSIANANAGGNIRLKLVQFTQNPYTKEVKFAAIIYSPLSSDRVQIEWDVTGASELVTKKTETIKMQAGQVYQRIATIKPRKRGATDVIVRVQAFQADGIYTATDATLIGSQASGDVFPYNPHYQTAQLVYLVQLIATWGLIILGVTGLVLKFLNILAARRAEKEEIDLGY